MTERFVRAYPPAAAPDGATTLFLVFAKGALLLPVGADTLPRTAPPLLPRPADSLYLGTLDGVPVVAWAAAGEGTVVPEGWETVGLRSLYGRVSDDEYIAAGYALQLLHYRDHYRFCSRCGNGDMRSLPGTWGQECVVCGHSVYPPVSPAVLALVHDGGDRVLLAQKAGWGSRYSILAGFVEPGESLEGCVTREVKEEAGVSVADTVYVGSQPWPFPHQVMIGFTARWTEGEIVIDADELSHAAWFRWDALPDLPPPLSLSRQIIDGWVASRQGQ